MVHESRWVAPAPEPLLDGRAAVWSSEPVDPDQAWTAVVVARAGQSWSVWANLAARLCGRPSSHDGDGARLAIHVEQTVDRGRRGGPRSSDARLVAVSGSVDAGSMRWIVENVATWYGRVDVVAGHADAAAPVLAVGADLSLPTVAVDGGVPVGRDRDDQELIGLWRRTAATVLVTPGGPPRRYDPRELQTFLRDFPDTAWVAVDGATGYDLVSGPRGVLGLPAFLHQARQRRTRGPDGSPLQMNRGG